MNHTTDREQNILRMREEKQMTYEAIGDAFNLTRERIRQIYMKAAYARAEDRYRNEIKAIKTRSPYPVPNTHVVSQISPTHGGPSLDTIAETSPELPATPPESSVQFWTMPPLSHRTSIRTNLGFTQQMLADWLGVSRAAVARWESGERNPKGKNHQAYAKILRQMESA